MNAESIQNRIKKKFGSLSEFARQSGMDRYDLQKTFGRKRPDRKVLSAINAKATALKVRPPDGQIEPKKLDRLKKAIMKAGGVVKLCRENKQFSQDSVFHILQGRRKRMSGVAKALFEHFKIE